MSPPRSGLQPLGRFRAPFILALVLVGMAGVVASWNHFDSGPGSSPRDVGAALTEGVPAGAVPKPIPENSPVSTAERTADPSSGAQGALERVATSGEDFSLRCVDTAGRPIREGRLNAVLLSEEVKERVLEGLGFNGDDVLDLEQFSSTPITDGVAECGHFLAGRQYLVWAVASGHVVEGQVLVLPSQNHVLVLRDAQGVTIKVEDGEGRPVTGLGVAAFCGTDDQQFIGYSWGERLQKKFFYWRGETDQNGEAILDAPYAGEMSFVADHMPGLNVSVVYSAKDGETVRLIGSPSFTVYGRVTEPDGRPVETGYVVFFYMGSSGTEDAGNTRIGTDGRYRCDDVSAGHDVVLAAAYCDGYVMETREIVRPSASATLEMDFVLAKATAVRLRLHSQAGFPLDGIEVMASNDGFDWIPGSYVSDAQGFLVTGPCFLPGRRYLLDWWSGGLSGPSVAFAVPADPTQQVEVCLGQLGRFAGVETTPLTRSTDSRVELVSLHSPDTASVKWSESGGVSPWLPVGPYLASFVREDGMRWTAEAFVEEGENGTLRIPVETGALGFELPEQPDGGEWSVRIRDRAGASCVPIVCAAGTTVTDVPVGEHTLWLGEGAAGSVIGPFFVPASGLDLGRLGLDSCAIRGMVVDENGSPWKSLAVELMREDGYVYPRSTTSGDGAFEFGDLSPGEYRVRIRPGPTTLLSTPDQHATCLLGAGESAEVTFVVPGTESARVELGGAITHPIRGFHHGRDRFSDSPVDSRGGFQVAMPAAGDWLGAYRLRAGEATVYGHHVTAVESLYLVDGAGNRAVDVRLLDARGVPLAGTRVDVRLGGVSLLPSSSSTTLAGALSCSAPAELPLELLVRLPSGGVVPLAFSALPAAGDVVVGADCQTIEVVCRDLAGEPVSGVTVWSPEARLRRLTDARGAASLPGIAPRASLRIESAGFWPLSLEARPALDITLRRPVEDVRLRLPEGLPIAGMSVAAAFTVGRELVIEPRWDEGTGCWRIGPVPEGEFHVVAWDRDGAVVVEERILVTASGPPELRLR